MSKTSLIPITSLTSTDLEPSDCVVFGGTFDPIHAGHLSVINSLQTLFNLVIIAPTRQNPWKGLKQAPANLPQRIEMIRLVLNAESLRQAQKLGDNGIFVSEQPYVYAEELVKFIRARLPGKLFWCVGEDSAETISHWKNWDSLEVTALVAPVIIDIHASLIRKKEHPFHPAIREYVENNGLYK